MISPKAKLHNRFDFEIYDKITGKTEHAKAENIVLNNMWSRLCGSSAYFGYIGIGTGSGTLSPTRTTLFSHLAYKSAEAVETVYDTDTTAHITKKVTFNETEANGTWTEVGILYGTSTGSNYVTHALITDSEGNPITVSKTDTKIITVYATVFGELLTPASGQYNTAPGERNAVLKTLMGENLNAGFAYTALLRPDGGPSMLWTTYTANQNFSSDAANKRKYTPLTRLAAADGNAPVRGVILHTGSYPYYHFGGASLPNSLFSQKNYTGIAVGTGDGSNKGFDFPISFVKSASETVYVDGVAKTRGTDYTVRYGMGNAETVLVFTPDALKTLLPGSTTFEEIAVLPQPSGEDAAITSIEMKNGSSSLSRISQYNIKLSMDGETWVDAGASASWSSSNTVTLNSFTPAAYKYIKIKFISASSSGAIQYMKIYATPPSTKHIVFTTAPASGAAITVDFATEYINKTSNYVLDVQAEILFGEQE